jgi:hypothetical protein
MSAPPILALELGNNIGDPLFYDDEGLLVGMFENWSPERFARVWGGGPAILDLEAAGAFFGGVIRVGPEDGDWGNHPGTAYPVERSSAFDAGGQAYTLRMQPPPGTAFQWQWNVTWSDAPGDSQSSVIVAEVGPYGVDDADVDRIRLMTFDNAIVTGAFESDIVAPYSATSHAWFRCLHDPETHTVHLQTGPNCGSFVTRHSRQFTPVAPFSGATMRLVFRALTGPTSYLVHEIYVDPFRPEMLADI